jgi:hypothetical protein
MKKTKFTFSHIILTLSLTGFAACVVRADTQADKATVIDGGSTNSPCPGVFHAYAKMTNSAGAFWLTPSNNASSGTFTDASGFAPPYSSVVFVTRKRDLATWCGTNSVTFPATNSTQYSLTVYIKSTPPPPTNSQPLMLQIHWQ